jgi:hypothetical protein
MKRCKIIRYATSIGGTRSHVIGYDDNRTKLVQLHGLECPWQSNTPYSSCIPDGIYTMVPWESGRFGDVFSFVGAGVSPWREDGPTGSGFALRWGCHVHPANYARQLEGCLALGLSSAESGDTKTTPGRPAVWRSAAALKQFRAAMGYGPIYTEIVWRLT